MTPKSVRRFMMVFSRDGSWYFFELKVCLVSHQESLNFIQFFYLNFSIFSILNFEILPSKKYHAPSLKKVIMDFPTNFGLIWTNSCWEKLSQLFWYSVLFLQLHSWCKWFNGLDDFKAALYDSLIHRNTFMHAEHCFTAPLVDLWCDTLTQNDPAI